MQSSMVTLILFSVGYAIAGIIALVRMWGVQIAFKQDMKAMENAHKDKSDELQRQINELHISDKAGEADISGLSLQIAGLSTLLGEIRGELRVMFRAIDNK